MSGARLVTQPTDGSGLVIHDSVLEYLTATLPPGLPEPTWRAMTVELTTHQSLDELTTVGITAYRVHADAVTAEHLLRVAAEAGHADAANNLGLLLQQSGRPQDAEPWYQKAAEAGLADAANNLGLLLQQSGRPQDAEPWYQKAAEAGHVGAANNLQVLLQEFRSAEQAMGMYADQLAIALSAQWQAEARIRRLNDPYPLPIRWVQADPSLADDWADLVKLATSGAGWPAPPRAGVWAAAPDQMAGSGGELAGALARVPTGRLVVLGEPGSGKTMLMVLLLLDLLARRNAGGPVPYLASLGSWDPSSQDLHAWLADQLSIDHPALGAAAGSGSPSGMTRATALLDEGLILPILDGLDEIPESIRGRAITRINDSLRPGEQLVVTCRTAQYRDAVRPPEGYMNPVCGAAVVEICPLDADTIRMYQSDDAAGPVAKARWRPVFDALATGGPLAQALSNPLMVTLARAIYNPRPGELAGALADPAELCALNDRQDIESHLFDAFIYAAYRNTVYTRWPARQVEQWLVFLARHLERNVRTADIAWWQISYATPRLLVPLTFGLFAGGVTAVVGGLMSGVVISVLAGLAAGFAAVLWSWVAARTPRNPSGGVYVRTRPSIAGFAIGLAAGFVFGAGAGLRLGLFDGLAFGLLSGLAFGLLFGLRGGSADLMTAASPAAVLVRDRLTALYVALLGGLPVGLSAALACWLVWGTRAGIVAGIGAALVAGLATSGSQSAWSQYLISSCWLAMHHQLPLQLMSFLRDAHQRGVLRQAGSVYQFRHLELQRRLANRRS